MNEHTAPRLVIYPYEKRTYTVGLTTVYVGAMYVVHGQREMIDIVAGPLPKDARPDKGGHTADATPAGAYVLGKAEAHTTLNWPASVVPWGAPIREQNGVIQYQIGNQWRDASGPRGTVTQACKLFFSRTPGMQVTPQEIEANIRQMFTDRVTGQLTKIYQNNDFGMVSWNLKQKGRRTAYYIHTTPEDEFNTAHKLKVTLMQSHGCVHIRPADRDVFMKRGYLREGIAVEIKPYGEVGPPSDFLL